ncbi:MAG: nitroreductase family protein [Pseudomonadales bacterium]
MDAIEALLTRNSAPRLTEPAPKGHDLELMFQAALRAPDHAWLKPWRFLTIEGDARLKLADLMVNIRLASGSLSEEDETKLRSKALRAPLIVVVIADTREHPKVPILEQHISAGCAAHSMLIAAHALGYAGVWRTGGLAFDRQFAQGLGLTEAQHIVGFLYLGTREGEPKSLPKRVINDFVKEWN